MHSLETMLCWQACRFFNFSLKKNERDENTKYDHIMDILEEVSTDSSKALESDYSNYEMLVTVH